MRKLATLLFVLATATSADAKPKPKPKDDVKTHMDRAAKAHKEGKFDVALSELQEAYALDPQPKLLYAIAQVYAKLDNCEAAIEHYEKFDAATKDKSKQSVVKQAIEACKKKLAEKGDKPDKPDGGVFRAKKPADSELPTADARPEPELKAEEPKPEPKVEAAPEPKPEPKPILQPKPEPPKTITAFDEPPKPAATTSASTHKPWYRDVLGDALVLGGIGAGVGSLVMYSGAQSELDKADAAKDLGGYKDHRDAAEQKQLYTFVLAGGSIALVTAGVLRFALRSSHTERSVAVVPTGDGGLITWSGGF